MIIERVQVDGGFLDNLDLRLTEGLNVIIGGRGTGKTSIIELIRYCLGVESNTSSSAKLALEHALSTLGDGRVTVTLRDMDELVTISRSATDEDEINQIISYEKRPIIYSQKEIETVGLSAHARLNLLDSFDSEYENIFTKENLVDTIASITTEISTVAKEIEQLILNLNEEEKLKAELNILQAEEVRIGELSLEMNQKQIELLNLSKLTSDYSQKVLYLNSLNKTLEPWKAQLETLLRNVPIVSGWDSFYDPEYLKNVQSSVNKVYNLMLDGREIIEDVQKGIASKSAEIANLRAEPDLKIKNIKKEIEGMQQGAGALLSNVNIIRQKISSLEALKKQYEIFKSKFESLKNLRNQALDEYENIFNRKFANRLAISNNLNASLSPLISVKLKQSSEYSNYINSIISALRGSSLRYNEIAPILASSLSPRELVESVENNDIEFICIATGFSKDRVIKIVAQLNSNNLHELLTVEIEDDVVLELLDGNDYKEIQQLSVGQRCTVILPIVLEHSNRTVVLDQPEDHLDNAFVVDTLIKSIRQKKDSTQLLFTTHNANIPVLGEADNVIVMKSNGQRGYVAETGALNNPHIVESITTIMEGGREAFSKRANFYHENP